MHVGRKDKINLSSSKFANFIDNGSLYIDKTMFIEHVLQDSSDVLLFTRPRRTGKSLNMDMLAAFSDCKQNTAHLFKGLYIESSPVFGQINKSPVIYFNFRQLRASDYREQLKDMVKKNTDYYLKKEEINYTLTNYFDDKNNYDTNALLNLTQNLLAVYGVKPYILIDEYGI